eukprot:1160909-Pelagomonas_calceolata.AAC.10
MKLWRRRPLQMRKGKPVVILDQMRAILAPSPNLPRVCSRHTASAEGAALSNAANAVGAALCMYAFAAGTQQMQWEQLCVCVCSRHTANAVGAAVCVFAAGTQQTHRHTANAVGAALCVCVSLQQAHSKCSGSSIVCVYVSAAGMQQTQWEQLCVYFCSRHTANAVGAAL